MGSCPGWDRAPPQLAAHRRASEGPKPTVNAHLPLPMAIFGIADSCAPVGPQPMAPSSRTQCNGAN